jgi:hypothetical protein
MESVFVVFRPYIEYNDGDYLLHDESILDSVYINKSSAEARCTEIYDETMSNYKDIEFEGYRSSELTQSLIYDACVVKKIKLQE